MVTEKGLNLKTLKITLVNQSFNSLTCGSLEIKSTKINLFLITMISVLIYNKESLNVLTQLFLTLIRL